MLFVHISSTRLLGLFEDHSLFNAVEEQQFGFTLRFFSIDFAQARMLFLTYPPDLYTDTRSPQATQVHLLFIGFTQMTQALILQACAQCHYANGKRLRVTVVARNVDVTILQAPGSQLNKIVDLIAINGQYEHLRADLTGELIVNPGFESFVDLKGIPVTAVYIAMEGSDSESMCAGMSMLDVFYAHPVPVFVRLCLRDGFADLLSMGDSSADYRGKLVPFGTDSDLLRPDVLIGEQLDSMSRILHQSYLKFVRDSREGSTADLTANPSLMDWDLLTETLKNSNRNQADHIAIKIRALGYRLERHKKKNEADPSVLEFSSDEVELLARMEHARWCAEKFLDGWQYGKTKNLKLRIHPQLLPFNELTEQLKEYDREAVRPIPGLVLQLGYELVADKAAKPLDVASLLATKPASMSPSTSASGIHSPSISSSSSASSSTPLQRKNSMRTRKLSEINKRTSSRSFREVEESGDDLSETEETPAIDIPEKDCIISGQLVKRGSQQKAWKLRIVRVSKTAITYYKMVSGQIGAVKGTILKANITMVRPNPNKEGSFQVVTSKGTYYWRTSSNDRQRWMDAFSQK